MNLKDIIIFEDTHLIAVNKPSGLVVNSAETVKSETLYDLSKEYLHIPPTSSKKTDDRDLKEFYVKGGVLHRLDKDTSGVVLIAKTPEDYKKLKSLFIKRQIKKTYYALCFNDISKFLGDNAYIKVNLPIIRDVSNRHNFCVSQKGREAVSKIYPAKKDYIYEYKKYKFSFVKVVPKTGRTHQIRVHLKALNCEILGDTIYSGRKQLRFAKDNNFNLMLTAKKLQFKAFDKEYKLSVPFPKDFSLCLKKLASKEK